MIKPVIKKISVGTTQERIDNFFTTTRISLPEKGQYQSSKRVKEAIGKVLGKSPEKKLKSEKQPKRKLEEGKTKSNPNKKVKVSEAEEKDSKLNIVLPPKNWKKEAELKAEEANLFRSHSFILSEFSNVASNGSVLGFLEGNSLLSQPQSA